MSKILIYTVTGFLPFEHRELQAGDQVDIPITAVVVDVPESVRGLVQLVTETTVGEDEGRIYEIEYDETELGGTLLELDQCCHVGVPTAVDSFVLINEHIATAPFINSILSDEDNLHKLVVSVPTQTVTNGSAKSAFLNVLAFLPELGITQTTGYSYKMVVEAVATSDEVANGKDSTAEFIFVGQLGGGGSINTRHSFVQALDSLTASRVGEGILISFSNNTAADKQFWVEATLSVSKIPN